MVTPPPSPKIKSRSIVVCFGDNFSQFFTNFSLDLHDFFQRFTQVSRVVTCFRDVAIHIIAVPRTLHSSNHNAFMVKKYRNGRFES